MDARMPGLRAGRMLAIAVTVAAIAMGCGGDGSGDSSPVDRSEPAVETTEPAAGRGAELASAATAYERYLDRAGAADLGLDTGDRVEANVVRVTGGPDRAIVVDCAEVTEAGGGPRFVDAHAELAAGDGDWEVVELTIGNDGRPDGTTVTGCAPDDHGDRVGATVEALYRGLATDYRDPGAGLSADVLDIVGEPLAPALVAAFDGQAAKGWYRDTVEEHRFEVVGSDLVRGGASFVVGVCTLMPEGRYFRFVDGGAIDDSTRLFEPGTVTYTTVLVDSTLDGAGNYVDTIHNVGELVHPSDCWDRMGR